MEKFELTTDRIEENGTILYLIQALIDFWDVKAGDLGGYVEKKENLSQSVNACVSGNARVYGDADYIYSKGFGSHNRSTTMFRAKGGNICVSCGCFSGTLEEFESKVKETHGSNKFAREYLALVEAAKIHFEV